MTAADYNRSGILGGIASAKNRASNAPLDAAIVGRSPAAKITGQIAGVILKARRPVTAQEPIIFRIQKSEVQFRTAVIDRLLQDGAIAIPYALDQILIVG